MLLGRAGGLRLKCQDANEGGCRDEMCFHLRLVFGMMFAVVCRREGPALCGEAHAVPSDIYNYVPIKVKCQQFSSLTLHELCI